MENKRAFSILEALFVTFLWSSSYIFIKKGLEEIPPITFAAYRYVLASSILMAYVLLRHKNDLFGLKRRKVLEYMALGFSGYFLAQGLQFFGLFYLDAITVTFILNMTPVMVLAMSVFVLDERPSARQLAGVMVAIVGVVVFFYGEPLQFDRKLGIALTLISGLGWATYMILTRLIVRGNKDNLVVMTSVSMFSGSLMMLVGAVASRGIGVPSQNGALIVIWLAIANTAFAFFLWNVALKTLKAYEQSILQNTMLIQITVLAILFLDESLSLQEAFGISVVFFGVLMAMIKREKKRVLR